MKKRLLSLYLALIMMLSLFAISAQASASGGAITTSALNLRSGASKSSSILLTMPKNAAVIIQSTSNGWSKVVYNGTEGYASADYLSVKSTVSGSFGTGTVSGTNVYMRSGAGTGNSIVRTCNKGDLVKITGVSGNWYAVSFNGKNGYICADYIKMSAPAPTPSSTPTPAPTPTSSAQATATVSGYTGAIIGTSVSMRSAANTSSAILGSYSNGVKMTVISSVNGWYKVSYNGKNGYVSGTYMRITPKEVYSAAKSGSVSGSSVNMRMGPSTAFSVVNTYAKGTAVKISGAYGNWYEISINGKYGYMSKDYIKLGSTASASTPTPETPMDSIGTVTGSTVRLRNGPGTNYAIVGYCSKGIQIKITGKTGNWYAATYNNVKGYISADYVSIGTSSKLGNQIVATAKEYLGVPYIWGGTSPKGFDCSGLVYYVYQQYGYPLQRRASLQYANNGKAVSKSNLQPGDLVFFSDSVDPISHVGMYIGDGRFIHASSGKGCVTISDLSSSYYTAHYVGAKRIIR